MLIKEILTESNWSKAVTERKPGTFAKKGIHTLSAGEIYKEYKKKSVSPHGLGSAIQMIQFFINRAGKNLTAEREHELKKAIKMLQKDLEEKKEKEAKKKD